MREIINTTVFDTDDVMAYVEMAERSGKRLRKNIKIRYLAKPKTDGWATNAPTFWVHIALHEYKDDKPMEVAILRPSGWHEAPLMALARAADTDTDVVPVRIVLDLSARLAEAFQYDWRDQDKLKDALILLDRKICVHGKASQADKNLSALRSLRTQEVRQQDQIAYLKKRLSGLPLEIKALQSKLQGCVNSLPLAEDHLKKIKAKIEKREAACTLLTDSQT